MLDRENVDELLTFGELDHSIENKCTCAELNQEDLVLDGKKLQFKVAVDKSSAREKME